jgi:hypothetical protein
MKMFLIVAITVAVLGGYAFSQIVSERQGAAQRPVLQTPKGKLPSTATGPPSHPSSEKDNRNWARSCAHLCLASRNYQTGLNSSFHTTLRTIRL